MRRLGDRIIGSWATVPTAVANFKELALALHVLSSQEIDILTGPPLGVSAVRNFKWPEVHTTFTKYITLSGH
jgi:hypothetical protein